MEYPTHVVLCGESTSIHDFFVRVHNAPMQTGTFVSLSQAKKSSISNSNIQPTQGPNSFEAGLQFRVKTLLHAASKLGKLDYPVWGMPMGLDCILLKLAVTQCLWVFISSQYREVHLVIALNTLVMGGMQWLPPYTCSWAATIAYPPITSVYIWLKFGGALENYQGLLFKIDRVASMLFRCTTP